MGTQIAGGRLTAISSAVLAVLAADLGTTDLSATGRVAWGRWVTPRTFPFLAIDLDGVATNETDPPLGYFVRAATFHVEGWYTVTTSSPVAGMVFANLMASEVMAAVENAHRDSAGSLKSASYMIRSLYFDDYQTHETEIDGHPIAHWTAKLVIVYHVERGL